MRCTAVPLLVLLTLLPVLLTTSCGPILTYDETLSRVSAYAARMSFAMENISAFQIRGRASVQDGNLLANGPFVLWGSMPDSLLRGDFYGPDGKPVVSLRVDPAGALVYFPADGEAVYSPGGIPVGSGRIPVTDLISLVRTGFPVYLEQWQVVDGAAISGSEMSWAFHDGLRDTLIVVMETSDLFPGEITWSGGCASITGSTWHDEFNAWPAGWVLVIGDSGTEIAVTRLASPAEPWDELWNLNVPVEIDTLAQLPSWSPGWEIEIR